MVNTDHVHNYTNEPAHTHTHVHARTCAQTHTRRLHPLGSAMHVLIILSIPHHSAKSKNTAFPVSLRDVSATLSNSIGNFETKSRKLWLWAHNEAHELTDLLLKKKRGEGKEKRTYKNSLICPFIKYC